MIIISITIIIRHRFVRLLSSSVQKVSVLNHLLQNFWYLTESNPFVDRNSYYRINGCYFIMNGNGYVFYQEHRWLLLFLAKLPFPLVGFLAGGRLNEIVH